ncbi:MAG: hypothetical protein ACE5J9_05490 [Methanosarcinales archaeon]
MHIESIKVGNEFKEYFKWSTHHRMIRRGHKYEIIGWDNQYGEEFPETMPHIHYNENEKIKYIERKTTLDDVLKVIEDRI